MCKSLGNGLLVDNWIIEPEKAQQVDTEPDMPSGISLLSLQWPCHRGASFWAAHVPFRITQDRPDGFWSRALGTLCYM